MSKRHRPQPHNRPSPAGSSDPDLPSLIELERFTTASLHQWKTAAHRMEALQRSLHFGLEDQRQHAESLLLESIRSCSTSNFSAVGWGRIVDLRYSLDPLSIAGSIKGIGGRFNVGAGLSPGVFTAFPALYCAESYRTAFFEKFGSSDATLSNGLSGEDLALRTPGSFTFVRLNVNLENLLDISDHSTLKPMVEILREFAVPKSVTQTARKLGLKQTPWLIRSSTTLQKQLLHPNWRLRPMQFDLPANSQIFGRLVAAAGIHGILYPSSKDLERRCLALFPQNWAGSTSVVEIADVPPAGIRVTRRDGRVSPL
jgi:RES domain-containing protein